LPGLGSPVRDNTTPTVLPSCPASWIESIGGYYDATGVPSFFQWRKPRCELDLLETVPVGGACRRMRLARWRLQIAREGE
jgi:hypothetical protein